LNQTNLKTRFIILCNELPDVLHQPLVNNKLNETREKIEKFEGVGVTTDKSKTKQQGIGETFFLILDSWSECLQPSAQTIGKQGIGFTH
jgi:hypothetical protein